MSEAAPSSHVAIEHTSESVLLVRTLGNWRGLRAISHLDVIQQALNESSSIKFMEFDTGGLSGWDSRFVAFVSQCGGLSRRRQVEMRINGLPQGVQRLLRLAQAAPEKMDPHPRTVKVSVFEKLGSRMLERWEGTLGVFTFLGQNIIALGNLMRGHAQFRWADAFREMEQTGPQALGIVAMINFLVGLILAFVGAVQLARFGASIYVADLVAIATVREMGCIMTGIILCGRTGAAFAAQLGTMKVNEEISALQTFGISPIEFLVLPRMVAMILMMPFLCLFADLISIAGGFCVSVSMLDIAPRTYLSRTVNTVDLVSFLLGIIKGSFFGFLVAFAGCLRGMQSGYTAADVGQSTTRAVVTGISAIIAADGIFAVLCSALHL